MSSYCKHGPAKSHRQRRRAAYEARVAEASWFASRDHIQHEPDERYHLMNGVVLDTLLDPTLNRYQGVCVCTVCVASSPF